MITVIDTIIQAIAHLIITLMTIIHPPIIINDVDVKPAPTHTHTAPAPTPAPVIEMMTFDDDGGYLPTPGFTLYEDGTGTLADGTTFCTNKDECINETLTGAEVPGMIQDLYWDTILNGDTITTSTSTAKVDCAYLAEAYTVAWTQCVAATDAATDAATS